MRKRGFVLLAFLMALLLQMSFVFAALGIGSGKKEVVFEPGKELSYNFHVYADAGQEIEIYSAGEFSELVEFDKKEMVGEGSFSIRIKLPDKIEKPGPHTIIVGARQKVSETEVMGTRIAIQIPIIVFVPYPGKYAEMSFFANNANVGEDVLFEMQVASLGKEAILARAYVDIYSGKSKVETVNMGDKVIGSQEKYTFKKKLNTGKYKPGDYNASAALEYDAGEIRAGAIFRIGSLVVNITNYTSKIVKKGIQPFEIGVESLWNNDLEDVFGVVSIYTGNNKITDFITPSISLNGWEKKDLIGYLDTSNLEFREYTTEIRVNYAGNFSSKTGTLEIIKETNYLVYVLVGVVVLLGMITALAIWFYIKNKNETQKKKRK